MDNADVVSTVMQRDRAATGTARMDRLTHNHLAEDTRRPKRDNSGDTRFAFCHVIGTRHIRGCLRDSLSRFIEERRLTATA